MARARLSSTRARALSLGDDRQKLVEKFNKAHPRPGLLTRVADRIVAAVSGFASKFDRPEQPESETAGVETTSTRRVIAGFAITTILFPFMGPIDRAPVFFGAMAAAIILSRAWTLWHRSHPPIRDADARFEGILPAFLQGAAALGVVLLFHLALKYSMFHPVTSDLNALLAASGSGVFVYQRRTGMTHKDPEIWVIVVAVALIFSGVWTVATLFLGNT